MVLNEIYNPHPDAVGEDGVPGMMIHWDEDMQKRADEINAKILAGPKCKECGRLL